MGVQERLSLEAISAGTLIASEHVHRYRLAASLCRGMRVVDLACGSGYGSAILRETAESVTGVDNDAPTIDEAGATIGTQHDIAFEAADALEFLGGDLAERFDAIVCFEGLEHFDDPKAVLDALARHADAGMSLVLSVPNSEAYEEDNEFHRTDYGYESAMAAFERFGEVSVLYQFLAEGSLIRADKPAADAQPDLMFRDQGEPRWANHFIACVNLTEGVRDLGESAQMRLAVAPLYNRWIRAVDRANRELWRENTRLGRERVGTGGSAAVVARERLQQLEQRIAELERMLASPRHQWVERARDRLRHQPVLDRVARAVGKRFSRN